MAALIALIAAPAYSQSSEDGTHAEHLGTVLLKAYMPGNAASLSSGEAPLAGLVTTTSDSAALFSRMTGVSLQGAGGVSALPVVNGFASDRVKTVVDGMQITASCGNFMNPALSYIAPTAIADLALYAGLTPVSEGGDSIGGTIRANSPEPEFSEPGEGVKLSGQLSAFGRSNGDVRGAAAALRVEGERFSLSYDGSHSSAGNYKDGSGAEVKSTEYSAGNHKISAAARFGDHTVGLAYGWQNIPYQAFPNQAMDMTDNSSSSLNAFWKGSFDWGDLEARLYQNKVRHSMDMLADKSGTMPMETDGRDRGLTLHAGMDVSAESRLRLGAEYLTYRLDDWWPPVGMMVGMMGPDTYLNINDGQRDRAAVFAELDTQWNDQWQTVFGLRYERVTTNAGEVRGYSMMYQAEADAFNARDHKRVDHNLDLTATARFTPAEGQALEFGLSRKTRSPNLYERYTWSSMAMAASMTNWFGDLNGWVGNVDLKPETANTLALSYEWHDPDQNDWHLKASAQYSRIEDYITGERIGSASMGRRAIYRFVNHDADMFSLNLEGAKVLGEWYGNGTSAASFPTPVARTARPA
ncbi:TonB-dependent receptor [Pseudogemmobacter bohemicus]|uniref:TonB-dependent receptor n=1 Tax=Pseudogemmobacter bohemicus TaxID=2250708 RepID=UPI0018E4F689|nr:TonB-dependent receptor [Pseudogemmobacter bohemicus]